jgi:hypothetical protein
MEGPRRKKWSPEISSAFWVAYSALCDLLKPVTIDTIEASRSKIKAHKFHLFWTIANDLAHAEDGAALPDSSFGSSRDIDGVGVHRLGIE